MNKKLIIAAILGLAAGMGMAGGREPAPAPRFTVQADTNCVLDNRTGLIWARNASLFGKLEWGVAITNCATLSYGGRSDWRLPGSRELDSLMDARFVGPALCNTAGDGKWAENDPFTGVQSEGYYWTSSEWEVEPVFAWGLYMVYGSLFYTYKAGSCHVWPVRGELRAGIFGR